MKKILYIHHGKGLGGAPLSLLYLVQNLDKTKYEPIVLFLHDSDAMDLYKKEKVNIAGPVNCCDFPHTKIRWYRFYHPHLLLKSINDSFKVVNKVADYWFDKIKPDLVHLNTSSLIAWARVAKRREITVVFHVREPLAKGYLGLRRRLITNFVKKYSDIIMPICRNDARPWVNNKKVNVVYNAVDNNIFDKDIKCDEFFTLKNLSKEDPKILFLGGLSREKGTLEILKIFKQLLKVLPNAKLLIAGYFNLELNNFLSVRRYFPVDRYKIKVKKVLSQIKDSVIFLGPIKNVPQAMAGSDVIVFPATVGHFARPIIEAGFMQKPVVASKISPLDELVINNKTGFLIDIKSRKLWVENLYNLLVNKNLNKEIGTQAYHFCLEKFDIKKQVVEIANVYQRILS